MTTIQTPVQPPRNPKYVPRHSIKFWLLIVFGSLAGLIVLSGIVAAIHPAHPAKVAVSASTSVPAKVTPAASPRGVPAAPKVTQAPAPRTASPQGLTEKQLVAAWVAGPGYGSFQAVQADITAVQADATGQNLPAIENDGSTLAADAQNAAVNPPPVGSGEYQTAMKFFAVAGNDMAIGDIADAATAMRLGTAAINIVTADMKALLPAAS